MCFKNRDIPLLWIYLCSGYSILAGICVAILAVVLTSSDLLKKLEEDKELGDVETARNLIFISLMIFAMTTILVAAVGLFSKCCYNKCFFVLFGTLLLPTMLINFIFGGLCYVFATASDETTTDECKKQLEKFSDSIDSSVTVGNEKIDISLNLYVDSGLEAYMCSTDCPCKNVDAAV